MPGPWHAAPFYTRIVLLSIAVIFAFTWPNRRGKALLCSSLVAALLAPLPEYVFRLLFIYEIIPWGPSWGLAVARTLQLLGALLTIASAALLLAFVVVARKEDGDETSTFTETEPRIALDEQASLYCHSQGHQSGPMSFADLRQRCADGQINRLSDRVWFEGAEDWLPVTRIEGLFSAPNAPGSPTPPSTQMRGSPIACQPARTPLKGARFPIILRLGLASVILSLIGFVAIIFGSEESEVWIVIFGVMLLLVAVGLAVALVVIFCMYVYRMWQIIQDYSIRATPGKAVGFLFIPFFNLYWVFQAYYGWSQDYNQFIHDAQLTDAPRMPEALFLAFSILCVIAPIPYIGLLALVPQMIVYFIMARQICRAINHFAYRY